MATKQLKTKYLSETAKKPEEFNLDLTVIPLPQELEKEPCEPVLAAPLSFEERSISSSSEERLNTDLINLFREEILSPTSVISPFPQRREICPTASDISMVCQQQCSPTASDISMVCQQQCSKPFKHQMSSPTLSVVELGEWDTELPLRKRTYSSQDYRPQGLRIPTSIRDQPFELLHGSVVSVPSHLSFPVVAVIAVPGYNSHDPHLMSPLTQHPHGIPSFPQQTTRMSQQVGIHSKARIPHGIGMPYNSGTPQHPVRIPQKSEIPSNKKISYESEILLDQRNPPGSRTNISPLQRPMPPLIRISPKSTTTIPHGGEIILDQRIPTGEPTNLPQHQPLCLGSRGEHIKGMHQQETPAVIADNDQHDPDDPNKNFNLSFDAHNGEKRLGKDERKAREMGIDSHISIWDIVMLPHDQFNEGLATSEMTEEQIEECRGIRRRGKNKLAAQNCRKRKTIEMADLFKKKTELSGYLSRSGKVFYKLNQNLLQLENLFIELEVDILDQLKLNKKVFNIICEQGYIKFGKRETCKDDLVSENLILDTTDEHIQAVIHPHQNSKNLEKQRRPTDHANTFHPQSNGQYYQQSNQFHQCLQQRWDLSLPNTNMPTRRVMPPEVTLTKVSNPLQRNDAKAFHPASDDGVSFAIECIQQQQDLPIATTNVPIRRVIQHSVSATQISQLENEKNTHISRYNSQVPIDPGDLKTFQREPTIVLNHQAMLFCEAQGNNMSSENN